MGTSADGAADEAEGNLIAGNEISDETWRRIRNARSVEQNRRSNVASEQGAQANCGCLAVRVAQQSRLLPSEAELSMSPRG